MIRLEAVGVRLGRFALRDVSLEVPAGGYGLVIGPTGAGKTTLLEAVAGHVPLTGGRVLLRDRDVTAAPPETRGIGFVYQHYHLFPHFSVRRNIGYGLRRMAPEAREARVAEVARLLGVHDHLDRAIGGLSGGERQRVAVARALAPRPSILLLDEPFAAVDPASRRGLRRELRELHEREGITTLQVTHDFEDAMRLGDIVAVLAEGRIAQVGRPEAVFQRPNSRFVAEFIGSGNVLRGVISADGGASPAPADGEERPRFPARFRTGGLELEVVADRTGEGFAVLRPTDLLLSATDHPGPPRNHFPATVRRLEPGSAIVLVHLEAAGVPLVAAVMDSTAHELGLAPGRTVTVAVKATAVHLI
ncbi:MAG: ABC transporter ATP-binding protein [Gemmatimonadales bacterium]